MAPKSGKSKKKGKAGKHLVSGGTVGLIHMSTSEDDEDQPPLNVHVEAKKRKTSQAKTRGKDSTKASV